MGPSEIPIITGPGGFNDKSVTNSRLNADLVLPPVNEFVNMYKPVENKNFDYFEFPRQLKFLLNR
jgi:hypothetical protein